MEPELDTLRLQIMAEIQAERWREALGLLERWCGRKPADARAWANRGYCLMRLGRNHEALHALDHSLVLGPELDKTRRLRDQVARRLRTAKATAAAEGPAPTVRIGIPESPGSAMATGEAAATSSRTARWRSTRLVGQRTFGTRPTTEGERVWREGSVIAGRYEVLEVLRGGMGLVYVAFDRELQRVVAVKTPLPSVLASEEGSARFHREAEAWIALGSHPNICSALYVQEIGGMPRLFIEYVDGGDLDRLLESEPDLGVERQLDITIQIARGMAYTHSFSWADEDGVDHSGLVHRDLKPANVLLTSDGTVRVTDFGLVRVATAGRAAGDDGRPFDLASDLAEAAVGDSLSGGSWQTVTQAGGVLGTPPYLAPELWRQAARATPASDVYAFGCILYEIFCGRRPFSVAGEARSARAAQLAEWMRLHTSDAPPNPRALAPSADPELAFLMEACLAKRTEDRPGSFSDIQRRLLEVYERTVGVPYPRPEPQRERMLADSLNNRAVSYVTLGATGRAARALVEALRVDPHHLEATYNLCLLEWRSRGLTDAEMVRRLEEARRGSDAEARGMHLIGKLRLLLGDPEAALSALCEAAPHGASSHGASLELRRDLGLALLAAARAGGGADLYREAAQELEAVGEAIGTDLVPLVGRAAAVAAMGEAEEAAKLWEHAQEQAPNLPDDLAESAAMLLPGTAVACRLRHPEPVTSCALLGGNRLACRDATGTLTVWDLGTGAAAGVVALKGEVGRGRSVAAAAGTQLALVSFRDLAPALVDLGTGERIRSLRSHPGQVTCMAVTSDCRLAVSGGSDRRVRMWHLASGECVMVLEGHEAYLTDLQIDDDGERVLSASADGTVRLWRASRAECELVLRGHSGAVNAICWLPRQRLAVSGGEDGTVRVWDLESGAGLTTMAGHGAAVTAVQAIGDDVGVAISGGRDQTVRLWDLATGASLRVIRLPQVVVDVAVPEEGRWLLASHGAMVSALDLPEEVTVRLPFALTAPGERVELAGREERFRERLESARARIAAGDFPGALAPLREAREVEGYQQHPDALDLWQRVLSHLPRGAPRGHAELRHFEGHGGQINAVGFTPDDRLGVSAGADGTVRVWDLGSGASVEVDQGHRAPVAALAISPDGSMLLSGARDGTVRLRELGRPEPIRELRAHQGPAHAVAVTPSGRAAVTAGEDGSVLLWAVAEAGPPKLVGRHHEAVSSVAVSPDGRFVVSGGWDRHVVVWSLERRAQVQRFEGHEGAVTSISVSPDCRLLASAAEDGTVRVWDRSSERIWRVLQGHQGVVLVVAFGPDGRFLATGGRDATMRLWDVRTGTQVRVVEGHTGPVAAVAFSSDGRFLLSGGADATARHWLLDWEPELPEAGDWDDRVRPFLEVFLKLRQDAAPGDARPRWEDAHFDALMADLARRGFGWVDARRVRVELARLASSWEERLDSEQRLVRTQAQRQQRRQALAPLAELASSLTRNLGLKLIALVVAAITLPLLIMSVRAPQPETGVLNNTLFHRVDLAVAERQRRLAEGAVLAYQGDARTVLVGDEGACDVAALDQYLATALNAGRLSGGIHGSGAAAADEQFRIRYHQAVTCLGRLEDPRVVPPILRRVDNELHPYRVEDLLSVLVRIGAPAIPAETEGLSSASEPSRHLAALALAYQHAGEARAPLVTSLTSGGSASVEAASFVLRELIVGGAVPEPDAFAVVHRLAQSIDPRVRRNAVRALILFENGGPPRTLLEEALLDPDRGVVRAARETREALRAATAQKFFGIDLDR